MPSGINHYLFSNDWKNLENHLSQEKNLSQPEFLPALNKARSKSVLHPRVKLFYN